jgi:hypothetical protein
MDDQEVLNTVARLALHGNRPFELVGVFQEEPGRMTIRFLVPPRREIYRLRVPLPSSLESKPWLTHPPSDAAESVHELFSFLTEEIETSAIDSAQTRDIDGDIELELAPYGFRIRDMNEHLRLLKAAGPDGWWGPVSN